jgi:acetoin utilization protein AcuB
MSAEKRTVGAWMAASPHTIGDDQTLAQARERMRQFEVRHLPVLHGGHLVGVLSERDITLVESVSGVDLERTAVDEAMTEDPFAIGADASLAEVAGEMAKRRIGAAIVIEAGDRAIGVFTTTDALRALAEFGA